MASAMVDEVEEEASTIDMWQLHEDGCCLHLWEGRGSYGHC